MTEEYETEEIISVDLASMFHDPKIKKWIRIFEKPIKLLTKMAVIDSYINQVERDKSSEASWSKWLKHLQIAFHKTNASPGNIPATGPTVILSNHPFGMIDGIGLAAMVKKIRPDMKVMTNHSLEPVSGLSDDIIGVDPYDHAASKKTNMMPMRKAFAWLKKGGCLIVFPSGDVSLFNKNAGHTEDPPWSPVIARIITSVKADVVPVFIHGRNTMTFYRARKLHERLASFMLARECLKKRGSTIYYSVGKKITANELQAMKDPQAMIYYLREQTYKLAK